MCFPGRPHISLVRKKWRRKREIGQQVYSLFHHRSSDPASVPSLTTEESWFRVKIWLNNIAVFFLQCTRSCLLLLMLYSISPLFKRAFQRIKKWNSLICWRARLFKREGAITVRSVNGWSWNLTWDQAFFFIIFSLFASLLLCLEGKKITPSSRERHKGIIGRGHDLRLRGTRKLEAILRLCK